MLKYGLTASFLMLASAAYAQNEGADAAAAGAEVYEIQCSGCHGRRLRDPTVGIDLRELKADERDRFDTGVLYGNGQMPGWQGILTDEEIDQLWAYIRANAYE